MGKRRIGAQHPSPRGVIFQKSKRARSVPRVFLEVQSEEVSRFVKYLDMVPSMKQLKEWSAEFKWVPNVDWSKI